MFELLKRAAGFRKMAARHPGDLVMPFTVESVPSLPEIQPCAGSAHWHDGDLYFGAYDGAAHAIRGER